MQKTTKKKKKMLKHEIFILTEELVWFNTLISVSTGLKFKSYCVG